MKIPALFALLALTNTVLAAKPNVMVIIADDLGYHDVGFQGSKDIPTPHLDKLAKAGAILDQFYVQPVCSPTRATLMTGRYPMRHGLQVGVVRPWAQYGLPLEEVLDVIMDSNESKLGADGNPIYDGNGKFLKGPNYWKPEPRIKALLQSK